MERTARRGRGGERGQRKGTAGRGQCLGGHSAGRGQHPTVSPDSRTVSPQYENQTRLLGKWGPRKLLGRPAFSDSSGRAGLPPEQIQPPKGWRWDGPWSVERPQR